MSTDIELSTGRVDSTTPDALLARFNRALIRLSDRASVANDPQIRDNAIRLLRQTLTTQLILDHYLVAVAGSQGAGKTTLVRNLYGLDERWLPGNLGVGEQLPIVIVENADTTAPVAELISLVDQDGTVQRVQRRVDEAEWTSEIRNPRSTLIARLTVPPAVFGMDSAGLLLLPGYELDDESADLVQQLMRLSLISSPAVLVVTDEQRLASSTQQAITDDLKRHYLEGRRPIVVVSRCEGIEAGSSAAEELQLRAAEVFEVSKDDLNSVVLTNINDMATWKPALVSALSEISRGSRKARRNQLNHLRTVIEDDGGSLLDSVQLFHSKQRLSGSPTEEYRDQLDVFELRATQMHEDFRRRMTKALDHKADNARGTVVDFVRTKLKEGWEGIWKKITNFFGMKAAKSRDELAQTILLSWQDADDNLPEAWQQVQDAAVRRVLGHNSPLVGKELETGPRLESLAEVSEHTVALARLGTDPDTVLLIQSVELLPVAALEHFRLASDPEVRPLLENLATATQSDWAVAVEGLSDDQQRLLRTLIGFVGVDLAVDASGASIPGLASGLTAAFGGGGAGASATATAAATSIAAAVVVAVGAVLAVRAMNNQDVRRRIEADQLVEEVRGKYWAAYDQALELALESVREVFEARLRAHFNVDDQQNRIWALQKALSDFKVARFDLIGACRDATDILE